MQEQASSDPVAPEGITRAGGWLSSVTARLETRPWIALILTCIAWFALDTLRVEWGPVSHGVRFYDMADVIGHPARLFSGLEGHRGEVPTVPFTLLCIAALIAPAALSMRGERLAWLGYCAPLILIVCVALLLKARTSGGLFQESGFIDTLGNDVRHLANHVFRGASATVAQTVTVGSGGYLALFSSCYLAWCGLRRIRNRIASHREPQ